MSGSFFGFNTAVRGLFTAQKHLDIINHNINNVNTPGYSRQKATQVAARPYPLPGIAGMIGTGSEIVSINRIRDEYLDYKYWSENKAYGEWSAKMELLADMEVTFNEPSESGFTTIMNEFFNALQELLKDASSAPNRTLVQQKGVTLAKYFNSMANHFEKLQADVNQRIRLKVEEINSLAVQIQQLNKQIYTAELDGSVANDLRDRRTLLVDELSKIVNIEANEVITGKMPNGMPEKHFIITINGKSLVNHFNVTQLKLTRRDDTMKLNEEDIPDLYEISWEDGNKFEAKGGELKGYLDIRDGNDGMLGIDGKTASPNFKGIPYYIRQMNTFVRIFAMAFNEGYIDKNGDGVIDPGEDGIGHADGYGLDPDGDGALSAKTGIRFFTIIGDDGKPLDSEAFIDGAGDISSIIERYKNVTAKNFTISRDVLEDYNNIATSDVEGEVGNIKVLYELIKMRHNTSMFAEGAPEDFMKSLIATLGIDSQQAVRHSENRENIIKQIENRRLAYSGVSLDEEMADMVRYQHAYNAAARMIVTMSEVYDTLINKLGV
ncbi:MAG: flagellar hook-associated protein FlgK [Firmicutes bacterium]|nr:flagellar hook-associated protein FlgK [Bacillota bacterium]